MPTTARGLNRLDAVALASVGLWCVWVVLTGLVNGRVPHLAGTYFVAPAILVAGAVLGRLGARHEGSLWVDALLLFPLVALLPGVGLRMAPGPLPLGYQNANSAAAAQVMALLALALIASQDRWAKAVLGLGVVLAGWSVWRFGSVAGIATAAPLALAILLCVIHQFRGRWWGVVLGIVTVTAAAGTLLRLAAQPTWHPRLLAAFDPVRKVMWEKALELWSHHPITGGGPGSYAEVNPYAHDTDTVAAHSSLLQTGSEFGWVGVALLVAIVALGFLIAARGAPCPAVIAAAAWAALWIQSLVDHLFDYPSVALLTGSVLGWASTTSAVKRVPRQPK